MNKEKKSYHYMISLQITKKQHDFLKRINKQSGETVSSIVRRLIERETKGAL